MSIISHIPNICVACKKHVWLPPWWKGRRTCILCGRREGLAVGSNSIQMSPGGTDVLKWSGDGTPTALGEMGMDTTTGVPNCYTDGSAQALSTGSGGGVLTLVEKKIITANAQSYNFSSLNGNSDYVYFLVYNIINNGGTTCDYYIRPNNSNSNCKSSLMRWYSTSLSGVNNASEIQFIDAVSSSGYASGMLYFFANYSSESETFKRASLGRGVHYNGTTLYGWVQGGTWDDESTNLISLTVYASISNGLGTGTSLWLYKLLQS